MIVRLTRFVVFTAGALGGFAVSGLIDWSEEIGFSGTLVIILFIILGCSIGYLLGGILGREINRWYDYLDERVRNVAVTDLVLAVMGIIVGLLIAILASSPLRLIEPAWIALLSVAVLTVLLGYGGMRVTLAKRADFARIVGRRVEPEDDDIGSLVKILDTSAVIDGRISDLMRISWLEGRVVVPRFVLNELQTLADSADDLKRARGRRGLDILEAMRGGDTSVDLFSVDYAETPDVDAKLLRLTQDTRGILVTVDFNLTKVARVQGIPVLNINELANSLRPNVMAGETMHVSIVREGKETGQGVAFLEDGTMIVVEGAADLVGQEVDATVTSIFQASAGRMVFARLVKAS